jgi:lipoprotein signal peptidase
MPSSMRTRHSSSGDVRVSPNGQPPDKPATQPIGQPSVARGVLLGSTLVLATDLLLKAAADRAVRRQRWGPLLPARNPDLSLQLLRGPRWVEIAAMVAVLIITATVLTRGAARGRTTIPAAALVLGGSAANLTDRVVLGSVRDFLVVGPVVINPADVAVLVGLLATGVTWRRTHRPDPSESRRDSRRPGPRRKEVTQ